MSKQQTKLTDLETAINAISLIFGKETNPDSTKLGIRHLNRVFPRKGFRVVPVEPSKEKLC